MASIAERAAALSPDRLALLQRRLVSRQTQSAALQRIPRRTGSGLAPLSFGQERMWFIDQMQPGNPAYNVPIVLALSEPLDIAVLKRSLAEIVRRHEVLRTTFDFDGKEPVQKVSAAPQVPFEIVDLNVAPEEIEAALTRLYNAEFQRPFDLTLGPLIRAVLIRQAPDRPPPQNRLMLTLHHIVSDAWSMQILTGELQALYTAFAAGLPSPLPDLEIQYGDFAAWQRDWLQGQRRDEFLSYWKGHLGDAPTLLNLPTDMPRPARSTFRGATQLISLSAPTVAKLKATGNAQRATLFMTMLSLFAVLLQRYTAEHDLVIGTPIANRGRSELEPLIGFFLNTLALRIDASDDPVFIELLERVREVALGAFAHQDLPFEVLVRELQPSRSLSANPLFQVMFVLQSQQSGAADGARASGDGSNGPGDGQIGVTVTAARFDLTLAWVERGDGLEGMFEYSTDLFVPATIERMARHMRVLAEAVAEQPDLRLSQLPLLTEDESVTLQAWNATAASYPEEFCIHQLFERRAREVPEATALVCGDVTLSYGELERRANQLAHYLQTFGVGPESLVGLFVERSLEMVVGLLGILKAGGAYLPLDPNYPAERVAFMMQDAEVDVVLTQQRMALRLPAHSCRRIAIDADWPQIARYSEDAPSSRVGPDNAAYVIYTSGSTGWPKGVVVPHRGAVNAAQVEVDMLAIRPDDHILQFASLNFDASMFELLMWMWGGAVLCVASPDDIMPGPALLRTIRANAVTVLSLPPSALAVVPLEPLESLRLIAVMGEACPAELVRRWLTVVGRIFNAYGPTEASMWVAGIDLEGGRTTIGRPIGNNRIHILDAHMNPVPVGVVGEIYIGGVGVARGYLRRPALTAERFLPDPFSEAGGGRLYRTGDLARYLPDGEIDFLGRSDHQVKVRGYRIELGEVETVLCRHPAVRQAAVLVHDQTHGMKTLVAHVAVSEPRPTAAELRQFLQQILPDYAVPSTFVLCEALPLTPSGKVARDELSRAEPEQPQRAESLAPTANRVQETMARIWAEVLGVPRVGLDDNFFDLGGHSLMAAQIIARLRDAFDIELSVHSIFDAATVRLLCEVVQQNLQTKPGARTGAPASGQSATASLLGAAPAAPEPAAASADYPLSFAQERMWFIAQMVPDNSTYNIPFRFTLAEPIDIAALERALTEVVRRHESLRTTFAVRQDVPRQVVGPAVAFALPAVDLRSVPAEHRWRVIGNVMMAEMKRPFDLGRGPLIRPLLFRCDDRWSDFVMTVHHIVTDGWSMGVLAGELAALYEAFRAGRASPLPELALQYRDYASWQRGYLKGAVIDRLLLYWRTQLAGAPMLRLPLDRPRPAAPSDAGAQRQFAFPAGITERLRQIGQSSGTTIFVVLLTAFKVLLWRYSRQTDIVVGTPVANRNRSEHESLIGLFINSLVLRTDLSGDPSFMTLVERVRRVTIQALAHQELPFERLVAELSPERVRGLNPLFQALFAYHTASRDTTMNGAAAPSREHLPSTTKFDFSLHVMEAATELIGGVEYNTALFDAATVDRMVDDFRVLLTAIPDRAEQPISALLVPAIETARRPQNGTRGAALAPAALVRPMLDHAAETPTHIVEEALAGILAEVLGLQAIGATDDFFRLGGHSLQVIRVLSRLRDVFDVELAVAQFFDSPTVAGLAALIMQQRDPNYAAPRIAPVFADHGDRSANADIAPVERSGIALRQSVRP